MFLFLSNRDAATIPILSQSHVDSSATRRKWIIFYKFKQFNQNTFFVVLNADAAWTANVIQSIKVTKGSKIAICCAFIVPQKEHTKIITCHDLDIIQPSNTYLICPTEGPRPAFVGSIKM